MLVWHAIVIRNISCISMLPSYRFCESKGSENNSNVKPTRCKLSLWELAKNRKWILSAMGRNLPMTSDPCFIGFLNQKCSCVTVSNYITPKKVSSLFGSDMERLQWARKSKPQMQIYLPSACQVEPHSRYQRAEREAAAMDLCQF